METSKFSHAKANKKLRLRRFIFLQMALALSAISYGVNAEENTASDQEVILVEANSEAGADIPVQGIVAKHSRGATKTDTPLIKTPQAITVIPRQQLDTQAVTSVAQAFRYVSGVVSDYRGSSNRYDEIIVRGFRYAARYIDGLEYDVAASKGKLDPWLLERVEIIRGPSSVLYGQITPGGLFNMVSKRPTAQRINKVQLSAGNREGFSTAFDFAGALNDDMTVLYRLPGIYSTQETTVRESKDEHVAIAPAFTFLLNERATLNVLGQYQYNPHDGYRNFFPATATVFDTARGKLPYGFNVSDPAFEESRRKQGSLSYDFDYAISEKMSFRQKARLEDISENYRYLVFSSAGSKPYTLARRAQRESNTSKSFTMDNQWQMKFNTGEAENTLLAGFDYKWGQNRNKLWRRASSDYDIYWPAPQYGIAIDESKLSLVTNNNKRLNQFGLYLQEQWQYNGWNVTLSGRQDWAELLTTNNNTSTTTQQNDQKFTGRAGLLYAFDSGISPYVSYSTSFEPNLDSGAPGTEPFKPKTARQYETGIKYQPVGSNTLITLAWYDIEQKNLTSYNNDIGYNEQIGKATSRGIETEIRSQLTEDLNLLMAYSYGKVKNKETNKEEERGKQAAAIPRHIASFWMDYRLPAALHGLTVGAGVRYVGTSFGNNANTYKIPAVTLYDAMLNYDMGTITPKLKGLDVRLNVNNIANKKYVASCSSTTTCFYGNGRDIRVTLSYQW